MERTISRRKGKRLETRNFLTTKLTAKLTAKRRRRVTLASALLSSFCPINDSSFYLSLFLSSFYSPSLYSFPSFPSFLPYLLTSFVYYPFALLSFGRFERQRDEFGFTEQNRPCSRRSPAEFLELKAVRRDDRKFEQSAPQRSQPTVSILS